MAKIKGHTDVIKEFKKQKNIHAGIAAVMKLNEWKMLPKESKKAIRGIAIIAIKKMDKLRFAFPETIKSLEDAE